MRDISMDLAAYLVERSMINLPGITELGTKYRERRLAQFHKIRVVFRRLDEADLIPPIVGKIVPFPDGDYDLTWGYPHEGYVIIMGDTTLGPDEYYYAFSDSTQHGPITAKLDEPIPDELANALRRLRTRVIALDFSTDDGTSAP